jgi:hypothetical protein
MSDSKNTGTSDSKNIILSDSKIFYSIGEVARMFDLNESTLRFWEKEFDSIKPQKTTKGFRQYTKADIEEKRESGIYLTVLGVGGGNLNDHMMEQMCISV